MVEASLSITLLLVLTLGFVDFGYALWQWNAASKAVQVGARMAAISPPVATEVIAAGPATNPGNAIPSGSYNFVCDGAASTCSNGTFNAANFGRILGGDDGACTRPSTGRPGMCDFFPLITAQNVEIRYASTGLGYQGRPGGAVPTITVSLKGLNYQFFFLGGLLGLSAVNMPSMLSSFTGEDLGDGAT
jgi:hypothetical protein